MAARRISSGDQVYLQGYPFQIVGITPPSFFGTVVGHSFDVAIPLCAEPLLHGEDAWTPRKDTWWLVVNGRLKPGITAEKATAQLRAISPQIFQATLPTTYNPGDVKHYLGFRLAAFPERLASQIYATHMRTHSGFYSLLPGWYFSSRAEISRI